MYNLGAVGFGHWFNRLYAGLRDSGEVKVTKIAGVSSIDGKLDKMHEMGLGKDAYYQISMDGPIPDRFYDGLDIVHISDPNEYHAEQTIDSLRHGKITITEKAWGIDKKEFDEVAGFIENNDLGNKAYLHLHYLQKQLTKELDTLLEKYTSKYGKVKSVSESFFEVESEEDTRRSSWLFSRKNGGLFMDWIHTFEIVISGAEATKAELKDFDLFVVNPRYSTEHPTGIAAKVSLAGRHFAKGATGIMRMAKGTAKGIKTARFYFESDAYIDLEYLNSETEFGSNRRGTWALYDGGRKVTSGAPTGPNTSEVFVNEILDMCHGKQAGLTVSDARKLFEPQWKYQELVGKKKLNYSEDSVGTFLSRGFALDL